MDIPRTARLRQIGMNREFPYNPSLAARSDMILIIDGRQVAKPDYDPIRGKMLEPNDPSLAEKSAKEVVRQAISSLSKDDLREIMKSSGMFNESEQEAIDNESVKFPGFSFTNDL